MGAAATAEKPIGQMSLNELHDGLEACDAAARAAKAQAGVLLGELDRRFGESAMRAYAEADKQHGTLSLPLQDGFTAKVDVTKKVEWDGDKLMAIAQAMPWERVQAIFKLAWSVPEKIFDGIKAGSPDLAKKLEDARTVKYGAPKITLVKD